MTDLFREIPKDEPEGRYGDGYPFAVLEPDPEFDITAADVADHWGQDYAEEVRRLILRHARLFRPEIEKFNDDVRMGIFFKPDADCTGLV